jgi:hydroxylamine reductase
MTMFCYQCQETVNNQGCTIRGVCGKSDEIAALQDALLYLVKGIAVYGVRARELDVSDAEVDRFVMQALFATVTNVSFDPQRFVALAQRAVELRDRLRDTVMQHCPHANDSDCLHHLPEPATWQWDGSKEALLQKAAESCLLEASPMNEDVRSLRELLIYGLKGLAAYADHADILGYTNNELAAFVQEGLAATLDDDRSVNELVALCMRCGSAGVQAMALLDQANTTTYGHPEPTTVNLGTEQGPAILISGHDLRDLDELLQQTADTGVNVYTHGEMLPAHAYPAFKKYPHLVGNYGGAWWDQQREFTTFNGPILMTTNCIQKPLPAYQERIFTTGHVSWPQVTHIADRAPGQQKDFSPIIEKALACEAPQSLESGQIPVGFAHASVLSVADTVIEAVKGGAISRFVVMAGCDGRQPDRSYYTEVARQLPNDTVILTAGCAKYRYNKLPLGDIGGIPRVLDAGQCNDSYSLVVVAQKLAEAFGVEHINELPISYDIAWYEQKAVLVLLALLSLGVQNIRLGPTLPAFLSPNVTDVLVQQFNIKPIGSVEQDLQAIVAGA